ncbi:MAG TPA: DUF3500 domain-containing protein [Methylomirabilota bacterium]|nr:DUF3500 domain-containing protein [Methylomirabilota bacterium]
MGHALGRRRLLHGAVATALLHGLSPARVGAEDAGPEAMARAASAFLATLEAGKQRRAAFAFADAQRRNWHYVPRRRQGLPFKDMPAPARAAAHELLKSALSAAGYEKAVNIIRLEEVLRQLESLGFFRDPEKYYVSIFGTPGTASPWGWRLEGHHLSLNFTVVPGRPVAVTPAFMGANPASVPSGPLQDLRTLKDEQDLGLALAQSLGPSLHSRLMIATSSLGDIVSGPGRIEHLKAPAGIGLGEMSAEQRALALRLVETYARNMRADIAEHELRTIREAGLERIHFAWAGPIDPVRPHYYRLHGPTVLIEYDNTQNDANHIHSVWHDPRNSFGADLLRAHYLTGHHHA